MSNRESSTSSSGSNESLGTEPDGAFSWLEPADECDLSPIIELSVADLEPDEADLALQDLLSDPDRAMFDAAERAAYAVQFAAELLGDDESDDLSDDPTLKIRVRGAEPEVNLDDWCQGFCDLGEVVAVAAQLSSDDCAGRDSESDGISERDSFDPVWFTTTLPTFPPAPPRSSYRRRAIGTLVTSSVMTAGIVLAMVGFAREPVPPLHTAQVGVASILEPGPSRSLESLTATGTIDATAPDAEGPLAPVGAPDESVVPVSAPEPYVATESLTVPELERMTIGHLEARELDAAIATAELWTRADPTNPRAYLSLGAGLIDRGQAGEAHRVLRTCVLEAAGPEVGECMAFAGRP